MEYVWGDPRLPKRFWDKTSQEGDCWIWTASKGRQGYGFFVWEGKVRLAHRVAYAALRDDLPALLDHFGCDTPSCVNPAHLRSASHRTNLLRSGATWAARNAAKTHCPNGHEYTDENTWVDKRGKRYCRACNRRPFRPSRSKSIDPEVRSEQYRKRWETRRARYGPTGTPNASQDPG